MQVKYSQANSIITAYFMAKIVPMLYGSPGIGKSALLYAIAAKFNLFVVDMRLAQCDPTDLLGMPWVRDGRAGYAPMDTFFLEGDTLPINPKTGKPYAGVLLFLDEMTSASRAVQAASYKLVLDRMVGQRKLHPNVVIACAGNKETDNAIVEEMSTALQSRMAHLELVLDPNEWIEWANSAGLDHRITDLIGFQSSNLYTFKPDHTDHTYACPRTWEFLDRLMKQIPPEASNSLEAYSGVVSEGVARTFLAHCEIYKTLPKIARIQADPKHVDVPDEPSILFALAGSISDNATPTTLDPLIQYVDRMPEEFRIVTIRSILQRQKPLMKTPPMVKWLDANKETFFA